MFTWLYLIVSALPRVFGITTTLYSYSTMSAGCSISRLNDYRLVSAAYKDSSGIIVTVGDTRQVLQFHAGTIQGSELQHAIPCSIHNDTINVFAYSTSNSVLITFMQESNDQFSSRTLIVTKSGNLTTDATIATLWSNIGTFIVVWAEKPNIVNRSYTLHSRTFFVSQNLTSFLATNPIKMDDNLANVDQLSAKIVKSKLSDRVLIVWREQNVIYGKIYSDVSETWTTNDVQKFAVFSSGEVDDTEWDIYQVLPLSTGGFIVQFGNVLSYDNFFYFCVLDEEGTNVFDTEFTVSSPFGYYHKDAFPDYIANAKMIEMPSRLTQHSSVYVTFVHAKYWNPLNYYSLDQYTIVGAVGWFFHLDFDNGIFLQEQYTNHYMPGKIENEPSCYFWSCSYAEYERRKLCIDLNEDTYEYMIAAFSKQEYGHRLHGIFGQFSEHLYNCNTSVDILPYLCISGEDGNATNHTYVMDGCYHGEPYYIRDDMNRFLYFDYSPAEYIISSEFNIQNRKSHDVFRCNVSDIHGFDSVTQCNGRFHSNLIDNVSTILLTGEECNGFVIPTTTAPEPTDLTSTVHISSTISATNTTSGACPYVANYYYSGYTLGCGASMCSSYSAGGAHSIGTCSADEEEGIGQKFVCINDAVYVEFYSSTTCEGEPAESHQVLSLSENKPEEYRAAYQYSCEDTGCKNYAKVLVSQTSYDALVAAFTDGQSFQCTNPGTDDWFDLYGATFITNVCVDSTGNATQPESSMKFGCDGATFTLYRYTNDRTCSTTPEVETHSFPGCIELVDGYEVWATLVCAETDVTTTQSSGAPSPTPSTSTGNTIAAPKYTTRMTTFHPTEDISTRYTPYFDTDELNAENEGNVIGIELKGATIAIIAFLVVIVIMIGIIVYLVRKKTIDKKQANEEKEISEEKINLKTTVDTQQIEAEQEMTEVYV